MSLTIAPCSYQAAVYAVTRWHYSGCMPLGRVVRFGVWENDRFAGAVVFGRGASTNLGVPYGLAQTEVCELTRVALCGHEAPVSRIVAACLRLLKQANPGLRLVVSFADPAWGHHGGIYQAGNWIYTGTSKPSRRFRIFGRLVHERHVGLSTLGRFPGYHQSLGDLRARVDPAAEEIRTPAKHRYLYPLDRGMRRRVTPLARPYPCGQGVSGDTPGRRSGEAGSIPADRSALAGSGGA